MHKNYFIYALEYGEGALVPVVFEVQELATHPHSGEILGAFGIGYSTESTAGECVAAPAYLLGCALEAEFAETLIHHIKKRHGCFVPHTLVERMPKLEMPIDDRQAELEGPEARRRRSDARIPAGS